MTARIGAASLIAGYIGCVACGIASVWLIVKCISDRSFVPSLSAPGLLVLSWILAILLIQLGTFIQAQAYGYVGKKRIGR